MDTPKIALWILVTSCRSLFELYLRYEIPLLFLIFFRLLGIFWKCARIGKYVLIVYGMSCFQNYSFILKCIYWKCEISCIILNILSIAELCSLTLHCLPKPIVLLLKCYMKPMVFSIVGGGVLGLIFVLISISSSIRIWECIQMVVALITHKDHCTKKH